MHIRHPATYAALTILAILSSIFAFLANDEHVVAQGDNTNYTIVIGDDGFESSTLNLRIGDTVTWINNASATRTLANVPTADIPNESMPNRAFLPLVLDNAQRQSNVSAAEENPHVPLNSSNPIFTEPLEPGGSFSYTFADGGDYTLYLADDVQFSMSVSVVPTDAVRILSYNVWMVTTGEDKKERAKTIPRKLKGYDVIILQEAFGDDERDILLSGYKDSEDIRHDGLYADYPYQTNVLGREGRDHFVEDDGGVVIVSKWPIERTFQKSYGDVCYGGLSPLPPSFTYGSADCLADKGILYALINIRGNHYHVFGTHTDAGDDVEDRDAREKQFEIIHKLIGEMNLPQDEPVIIAGDLNVDLHEDAEYQYMLNTLAATHPRSSSVVREHTVHPDNTYKDDNDKPKYLDYVLFSNNHLLPTSSVNDIRRFLGRIEGKNRDLSDHYAMEGLFQFEEASSSSRYVSIKVRQKREKKQGANWLGMGRHNMGAVRQERHGM